MIESESDDNADIIWGSVIKEDLDDEIKVTVIATGFDTQSHMAIPQPRAYEVAANGSTGHAFAADAAHEEDLDVPTFIRRQAD